MKTPNAHGCNGFSGRFRTCCFIILSIMIPRTICSGQKPTSYSPDIPIWPLRLRRASTSVSSISASWTIKVLLYCILHVYADHHTSLFRSKIVLRLLCYHNVPSKWQLSIIYYYNNDANLPMRVLLSAPIHYSIYETTTVLWICWMHWRVEKNSK